MTDTGGDLAGPGVSSYEAVAEGHHGRVDRETMQQGLEKTVADVVGLHLRDRLAVLQAETDLLLDLLHARVLAQILQQLGLAIRKALDQKELQGNSPLLRLDDF